ncbi:hypothetical protein, partial [Mycolicibacterium fortuitum]|uniref:hypothetical protein n=1 Tax=Mycolicibacterium fortuitum TaxID=1766 RepID=UPI000A8D428F
MQPALIPQMITFDTENDLESYVEKMNQAGIRPDLGIVDANGVQVLACRTAPGGDGKHWAPVGVPVLACSRVALSAAAAVKGAVFFVRCVVDEVVSVAAGCGAAGEHLDAVGVDDAEVGPD